MHQSAETVENPTDLSKKSKAPPKVTLKPLPKAKTETQKEYIKAIETLPMIICIGPAGTGKSFLGASYAAHFLKQKFVDRIYITRPNIPTGKSIGFFPGSLAEKMAPWTRPIMDTLEDSLGKGDLECQVKLGNIEVIPLETIRGRSFENAVVILDEAQNCSLEELKAFLTRIGDNCTMIINGDTSQSDIIWDDYKCPLMRIVELAKTNAALKRTVGIIEFTREDIVRSGLCQMWVEAFDTLGNSSIKAPDFLK